ncbi:MAG TPA: hypothetical protein ENJ79_06460 [Gammaproteobacteria bacterium]|nr:hypothetical protein [Gammaproteobacteria bacterium]
MRNLKSCVAIFTTHEEAEQAVADLMHAGLDIKRITIVGKGYQREEHVLGYYNAIDRIKLWGKRGAFWGGLWGIIFSPALIYVPVGATLTISRLLVSTLASGLSTAILTGSISALGAALYSIGVPRNSILRYETAVRLEKYLLIYHSTSDEVERARDILGTDKEADIAVY